MLLLYALIRVIRVLQIIRIMMAIYQQPVMLGKKRRDFVSLQVIRQVANSPVDKRITSLIVVSLLKRVISVQLRLYNQGLLR